AARCRRGGRPGNLPGRDPRIHQDGPGDTGGAAGAGRCGPGTQRSTDTMSDTTAIHRKDFRFFHCLRVRWAEVDMQKIVFNAHYLMYFDTAIADYWRALALPYEEAMHELGGDLYVRKATIDFRASARMDDVLDVGMRCTRIGNSSMVFEGGLFRQDQFL